MLNSKENKAGSISESPLVPLPELRYTNYSCILTGVSFKCFHWLQTLSLGNLFLVLTILSAYLVLTSTPSYVICSLCRKWSMVHYFPLWENELLSLICEKGAENFTVLCATTGLTLTTSFEQCSCRLCLLEVVCLSTKSRGKEGNEKYEKRERDNRLRSRRKFRLRWRNSGKRENIKRN